MTYDFNDVAEPPALYDLRDIGERLEDAAASWVPQFFPHGRRSLCGKMWRLADLTGRAPTNEGSCVIHLKGPRAGHGHDFSTNESAGPIALIGWATGLSGRALFDEAARVARVDAIKPPRQMTPERKSPPPEASRIIAGCEPLQGTIGEHYLSTRQLQDPGSPDLLFHPDLADFDTRRGYCGLVAIVRDPRGQQTGGIHRTFLLDDGSCKAPPGKKMLGPVGGGSVRLAPIGADGHLGIAEGIETALSATVIFNVPCWAALNDGAVAAWQWPDGVKRVTIFADAGDAGMKAAADLSARLVAAGMSFDVRTPIHGDDFNDDLMRGATAADYPQAAVTLVAAPPIATFDELVSFASSMTKPADGTVLRRFMSAIVRAQLEPIAERQLFDLVKRHGGVDMTTLRDQTKLLKKRLNATGDPDVEPIRPRWFVQLRKDIFGQPERNEANVLTALSNDEAFAGRIIFDEFRQEIMVDKSLPWEMPKAQMPRAWQDADDVWSAVWLQQREINVTPAIVSRSVQAIARDITIHPVREYLLSLKWDGLPRLQTWAIDYLRADDTPLNQAFGSLWMISGVARIMRPGAKVDHMLILEGPQGLKKSTAIKALAGEEWFTDELGEIGSKDTAQGLRGVWIIEIGELDALGRAEVSRIKAFLSRTVDRYRPPYGRYVIDVPRQCVFAGSVNPDTYLRDETGGRRFWPIRCGAIDITGIERDRDQLWAEAVQRFKSGAGIVKLTNFG